MTSKYRLFSLLAGYMHLIFLNVIYYIAHLLYLKDTIRPQNRNLQSQNNLLNTMWPFLMKECFRWKSHKDSFSDPYFFFHFCIFQR